MSGPRDIDNVQADVLVIGGGPAGCWAALTARAAGARVVLVDKGYVGTSGATPPTNSTVHALSLHDERQRRGLIETRTQTGAPFAEAEWIERVYEQTARNLQWLTDWGYVWPLNEQGRQFRGNLRGPDYMLFLRNRLLAMSVTVLDHAPALELLRAGDDIVGARGVRRETGRAWQVSAGAVVLATGGATFRSGAVGTFNLTGDGHLMALEAGARCSGMEFSGNYAFAPAAGGLTKGIIYRSATFSDEQGEVIPRPRVMRALSQGLRVFAVLDKADPYLADGYRHGQVNIFTYFDRLGGNPFVDRYEIRAYFEGTMRAAGGVLADDDGASGTPGLFIAGDMASRERLAGGGSSGGGPASSWAIASGTFAGRAAARHTLSHRESPHARSAHGLARVTGSLDYAEALSVIHGAMLPLERSFFRHADGLARSRDELDALWRRLHEAPVRDTPTDARDAARHATRQRELAAMIATGRVIVASALAREETLGLHRREDFPDAAPNAPHHVRSAGLDDIRVWREAPRGLTTEVAPA